mmetsp:Transcript_110482/g.191475  ORF Transcript_110482/g.191475 Transcript_110482/m.191475 type:complete len:262 (-) Transcript_110482:545-1330(-)
MRSTPPKPRSEPEQGGPHAPECFSCFPTPTVKWGSSRLRCMGRVGRVAQVGVRCVGLVHDEPVAERCIRGQRPPIVHSLHKVGVAQGGPPERHAVRVVGGDRRLRTVRRVPTVAHDGAGVDLADVLQGHLGALLMEPEGEAVHDLRIRQSVGVQHLQHVGEGLGVVCRSHPAIRPVGAQLDAHSPGRPHLEHPLQHLPQEASAPLHAPPIFIGPVVGARLEELVHQIPVGRMDFHPVKAGVLGKLRSHTVLLDGVGDFLDR